MIRTPRRHWHPKLGWLPHIPRQTPPPIDAPLIDVTHAHDGRAVVRRMARDGRRWLLPGSVSSAFVSLVNIGVPMALGRAIDDGVVAADAAALTGWLALVALAYLVRAIAQTIRMQTNVGAGLAEHDLRIQALERITAPEGIGGRSRLPGDLLAVVVTDVRAVSRAFIALTSIPGNVVTLLGALISMTLINGWLALATVCIVPLLILLSVKGVAPVKRSTRRERRAEAAVAGSAADLTSGLRIIQGLSAQRRATARFRTASRQGLDATLRTRRVKGVYTGTINASVGVFITALTVLAGWLTLAGRISVGDSSPWSGWPKPSALRCEHWASTPRRCWPPPTPPGTDSVSCVIARQPGRSTPTTVPAPHRVMARWSCTSRSGISSLTSPAAPMWVSWRLNRSVTPWPRR